MVFPDWPDREKLSIDGFETCLRELADLAGAKQITILEASHSLDEICSLLDSKAAGNEWSWPSDTLKWRLKRVDCDAEYRLMADTYHGIVTWDRLI